MNYIEVALVQMENGKNYIFESPKYSLKEGDKVICETSRGDRSGVVVSLCMVGKEEQEFLSHIDGVTIPFKRIKAKVIIKEFEYEES